jgi:hypothetical protein
MCIKVSLFRMLPQAYWSRMLPVLRPCLFNGGEVVCTQGDDTSDMYIILSGACRAFTTGLKEHLNDVIHLESQHADCNLKPSSSSNNKKKPRNGDHSPLPRLEPTDEMEGDGGGGEEEDERTKHNMRRQSSGRNKDRVIMYKDSEVAETANNNNIHKKKTPGEMKEEEMESFEVARFVVAGGVLNSLAALGVWPQCVESVVSLEITEAYVVNADDMAALFKEDKRLWDGMRKRAVMTAFAMVPDPEAPTEYGMPVHVLPAEEIAEREAAFEVKLMEESRKRWVAMERRKSGALALSSRAMMFRSSHSNSNMNGSTTTTTTTAGSNNNNNGTTPATSPSTLSKNNSPTPQQRSKTPPPPIQTTSKLPTRSLASTLIANVSTKAFSSTTNDNNNNNSGGGGGGGIVNNDEAGVSYSLDTPVSGGGGSGGEADDDFFSSNGGAFLTKKTRTTSVNGGGDWEGTDGGGSA